MRSSHQTGISVKLNFQLVFANDCKTFEVFCLINKEAFHHNYCWPFYCNENKTQTLHSTASHPQRKKISSAV